MQRLLVRFQSAGLYLRGNSPNEINDAHARGKVIVALQATRTRRSGSQGEPLGPCRLMEKPGGYDPSVARSSRVGDIQMEAVAEWSCSGLWSRPMRVRIPSVTLRKKYCGVDWKGASPAP